MSWVSFPACLVGVRTRCPSPFGAELPQAKRARRESMGVIEEEATDTLSHSGTFGSCGGFVLS